MNGDSPLKDESNSPQGQKTAIDDVTMVQLSIKTEMKINIKDLNKGRLSPDEKGSNEQRNIGFEIDEQLNQLISNG